MWFNNTTLRSLSEWGLSLTLKELVMWAFFPLFVFTGRNEEGGRGRREDQPPSEGFCPFVPAAVTLGELYMSTHIQKPTHGSPGVRSFHLEGRVKIGGWGRREGRRGGQKQEPPHLPQPQHGAGWWGSILKAALLLHGRTGWVGEPQSGVLLAGAGSSTLPSYPWQPERERETGEGKSERQRGNMEKLSCGQRALGWSRERRTKHPVIFIFPPSLSALNCPQTCPSFLRWK